MIVLFLLLSCCYTSQNVALDGDTESSSSTFGHPIYKRIRDPSELNGVATEVVYQPLRSPRALIFLAHGCSHGAIDFWDKSSHCRTCIGLPEEKAIVKACLRRHYVPIAISSLDRHGSRCWSEEDVASVKRAIDKIRKREGWEKMPLYALGASSGGSFLPLLANADVPLLKGLAMQIMATSDEQLTAEMPPIIFIHMKRDKFTTEAVENNVAALKNLNVKAVAIRADPLPIRPSFFSNRIEGLPWKVSHSIRQALEKAQLLDSEGFLTEDPRRSDWRPLVQPILQSAGIPDTLVADESPIAEELNVAWAMHEITSQFMNETFQFFETGHL